MKFQEALAKIPLPRLFVITLLVLLMLTVMEQLPWAQAVVEHLLNMEAPK